MTLILNDFSENYKNIINQKFAFLVNFFGYDPKEITICVMSSKDFEETYEKEKGGKSPWFVVGFAANNGRIFILDKKDFERKNHSESEFGDVVLHELCHIFIRRILDPKTTYIWIEEGVCEYLSFKNYSLKIKSLVSFEEIQTIEGWKKHNSYQQSRAFFKFLSEKFGEGKISELIKNIKFYSEKEAFKKVFVKELNLLQKEFFASLENEKVTPSRNPL